MRAVQALGFALWTSVAPWGSAAAWGAEWEELYTADEVTVSRKDIEGSRFVGFRGETVMNAALGRVLYVLVDTDHRTEWVDRLVDQRVLDASTPNQTTLYQAYALPAPFAHRDFVVRGTLEHDATTGQVRLELKSVEHPDAPPTVGVRGELTDSRYVLTPEGPDRTRVAVEVLSDPKGWMPAWLVNLIQRSWPVKTLNGVRAQLDAPWVGVRDPAANGTPP